MSNQNSGIDAAIETLQGELHVAEKRVADIRRALDLLEELAGRGKKPDQPRKNGAKVELEDPLADASLPIHRAAEIILERKGKPMKAAAVAEELGESPYPYEHDFDTLRRSVASALARKCEPGDPFYRHAHGTYGLREWKEENKENPSAGATAERPLASPTESIPEEVGSATREERSSKSRLPLSEGSEKE